MNKWTLDGKVCLITGASSGIGLETAVGLAAAGARVVMLCRDEARGEAARQEIMERGSSTAVDLLLADLASQTQVYQFINRFRLDYNRLDVLILNAAVVTKERQETEDGFEMQFAVNHLNQFLLARRLLDRLISSAPSRIIAVSSEMHHYGRIPLDEFSHSQRYHPLRTYANTKLANIMCTFAFARRLSGIGVTANCVHPGRARTHLLDELPGWVQTMSWVTAVSPAEAAQAPLYLAASPDLSDTTGAYFEGKKTAHAASHAYDEALQDRLYQLCLDLTPVR
jgi:NAD(P)-dependent dehydrogenase (short-subunit alcohol dehydrogenase family)